MGISYLHDLTIDIVRESAHEAWVNGVWRISRNLASALLVRRGFHFPWVRKIPLVDIWITLDNILVGTAGPFLWMTSAPRCDIYKAIQLDH